MARRAGPPTKQAQSTVQEFLEFDEVESLVIGVRVRVALAIRRLRSDSGMSQAELAKRMGITQPRVSSIEEAVGVSLDTLASAYIAAEGNLAGLASVIAGAAKGTDEVR